MRILNITAQKPDSTGSGIYMTELVNSWSHLRHKQAVIAGIYKDDFVNFPKGTEFYPVTYMSDELPFSITGMSDEMPYESTRYQDVTEKMLEQFRNSFRKTVVKAMEEFQPDIIVCHHLYLLTAMVREWYPDKKIVGICHGSDLRQICKNGLQREYIKEQIRKLDRIFVLHKVQKEEIMRIFSCDEKRISIIGAGYNPHIFYEEEKKEKSYAQIVFAGKVTEKKGIFSLFRALEKLPYSSEKITVKIAGGIGEPNEYQRICEAASQSRYEIQFLGVLPQRELADVFRESDLFVLPSFFEGLPLVTIEAMACGCRIVCSEILGMEAWLDENVPGQQVEFVKLPEMENVDEPKKEGLAEFEAGLAYAIQKKLEQNETEQPDLCAVSWEGISRKMLKEIEQLRI